MPDAQIAVDLASVERIERKNAPNVMAEAMICRYDVEFAIS